MPSSFFWIWTALAGATIFYLWILVRRKTKYSSLSLIFRVCALMLLFWLTKVTFLETPKAPAPLFVLVDTSLSMQKRLKFSKDTSNEPLEQRLSPKIKNVLAQNFPQHKSYYYDLFPESKVTSPLSKEILKFIESSALRSGDEIVLVSDGWDTEQKTLSPSVLESLKNSGVRVHTLLFPESENAPDLSLQNLGNPRIVFLNTPAKLSAIVSSNLEEAAFAHLVLSDGESILSEQEIQLESGKHQTEVTLNWTPVHQGSRLLQLRVLALEQEENTHNNLAYFPMTTRPQKLRVLHIAGRPSWDVSHLRRLLKSIPELDLISFFILRDPYADVQNVPESELSLIQFPVQELFMRELFKFDSVIFHNFDINKYLNNPGFQKSFQKYLAGGKRIIVVGGEQSANKIDYQRLFLKESVQKSTAQSSSVPAAAGVSKVFHHSQWKLHGKQLFPDSLLSQQASFSGIVSKPSQTSAPLLERTSFQLGRVDWVPSSSLWRWKYSENDSAGTEGSFAMFWFSLLYQPLHEEQQIFKEFQQLKPYSISDRISGILNIPSLQARSVKVEILDQQLKQSIWETQLPVSAQQVQLTLPVLSAGNYELRISCQCSDMKVKTHPLSVVNEWMEFQQPSAYSSSNISWLKQISKNTRAESLMVLE